MTFRQRWRHWKAGIRYQAEEAMVLHFLRKHSNACFIRTLFLSPGTREFPVIAPISSAKMYIDTLREAIRRTRDIRLQDETQLLDVEDTLDVMFQETNFVDACIEFPGGRMRVLRRPRVKELPLPPLPHWQDDDWKDTGDQLSGLDLDFTDR